ncbi:MAG: hypothetical protein K6A30_01560 [Lachnospiraceae bacterium]|nr:hypothetical protein [Lachnospiraceae bacterium]
MAEQREQFIVDGYVFETESQATQAKRELEGVRYMKERLDMSDPEAVLSIYNRILRDKMFSTPVGYAFLRELQEYLQTSLAIKESEILPLNFQPVIQRAAQEDKEAIKLQKEKNREKHKQEERMRKKKQRRKKREKINEDGERYRSLFINSLIVNIALAIVVVALFVIMHFSNIPTILNYENKLIDRYETWEQELDKREKLIERYEEKYGITNGYSNQ